MENGQTLSDLFHKFIRMTVRTDARDEQQTRRKHSTTATNTEQHRHPSAHRPPTHRRHPRATLETRPPPALRQTSTVTHFNLSSNATDTHHHHPLEHSYTDNDDNAEQGHGHADLVSRNTRISLLSRLRQRVLDNDLVAERVSIGV